MPFNGSGTYTLPSGNPVSTGTTISSATNNSTTSDIATALSNCVTRNGQSPATANIPMGSNKITGLAAGTATGDAINYDQVQYIANVASAGTAGQVLTSAGSGAPTWSSPTTTNLTGGATGSLPYQSAANTTTFLGAGTNGQILTMNAGVPSWQNSGTATNATNLAAGTAGQIPYQSGVSTTAFIPNGTAGQVLTSNGSSTPSWQTISSTNAANITGGAPYQLVYQSGYSSTAFIPNGLAGQVLLSNAATSNPSWGYYPFSSLSGRPTTLSGYGITDGVSTSGSYSNPSWLTSVTSAQTASAVAWSGITSKPTTVSGFGITDAGKTSSGNTWSGFNYFGNYSTGTSALVNVGNSTDDALVAYTFATGRTAFGCGVSSTSSNLAKFFYGTLESYTSVGSITTSGAAVAYNTTSDYRLKDVLSPITDATARIKQFRPIRFKWKDHINLPAVDGFLAHEVAAVVPEAVHGEKDAVNPDGSIKPQGLDQAKLVPVLIAALQDAFARIEALEARIV